MSLQGNLSAKDVMQETVITLSPENTLMQATEIFSNNRISGAPVVSKEKGLVGVLSQTDILREALRSELEEYLEHSFYFGLPLTHSPALNASEHLNNIVVEEVMNPLVITVGPDDDIAVLASTMRNHNFHRLIVAKDKQVVGIVTSLDLLQVLENH